MRSPAPYAVVRIARCLTDVICPNSCSTSPPVKTSGKVWGPFRPRNAGNHVRPAERRGVEELDRGDVQIGESPRRPFLSLTRCSKNLRIQVPTRNRDRRNLLHAAGDREARRNRPRSVPARGRYSRTPAARFCSPRTCLAERARPPATPRTSRQAGTARELTVVGNWRARTGSGRVVGILAAGRAALQAPIRVGSSGSCDVNQTRLSTRSADAVRRRTVHPSGAGRIVGAICPPFGSRSSARAQRRH